MRRRGGGVCAPVKGSRVLMNDAFAFLVQVFADLEQQIKMGIPA